ncbi:phosphocarrier protein [Paenibacillus sp. UNCCL117]|uniref:HPr family phosphocarrier protein n=1 Tax=unclassified Paenibacillus TaxID=185978 RepID=UPI00088675FA|nr:MULTISPECIES: HPr family phosphocarrier protein [unclassified Paenibacillus]SDC89266.1 phosphocarrier protein [Paenibacillus sp. cl123]SFW28509.1 phosphocarrier protein [Paenibacillus sp. UNCCL117]
MRVHEVTVRRSFDFQDWQTLSRTASGFKSDILLLCEEKEIKLDAKSVLGIMILPLREGTKLRIQTRGGDEEEALDAMCELLE